MHYALTPMQVEIYKMNGWVIDHDNDQKQNGEFYKSPLGFYQKHGFDVISNTRLELNKISAVKIKWESE